MVEESKNCGPEGGERGENRSEKQALVLLQTRVPSDDRIYVASLPISASLHVCTLGARNWSTPVEEGRKPGPGEGRTGREKEREANIDIDAHELAIRGVVTVHNEVYWSIVKCGAVLEEIAKKGKQRIRKVRPTSFLDEAHLKSV